MRGRGDPAFNWPSSKKCLGWSSSLYGFRGWWNGGGGVKFLFLCHYIKGSVKDFA